VLSVQLLLLHSALLIQCPQTKGILLVDPALFHGYDLAVFVELAEPAGLGRVDDRVLGELDHQ